jgi:hypothetical protein
MLRRNPDTRTRVLLNHRHGLRVFVVVSNDRFAAVISTRSLTGVGRSATLPLTGPLALHLRLLRHFESVVDLNPKVANRAFQLAVPEQQLNGPKVLGATVDQRRLGASQRVCPVGSAIEAELLDP